MLHTLEPAPDHRVRCTICGWTWAQRPQSDCPGVPRYGWDAASDHLKTFTQLKKAGLKPAADVAGCIYNASRKEWIWLYDARLANPRPKATPAQLEVLARAREAAQAKVTCTSCGQVAQGRDERAIVARSGLCTSCWEAEEIEHERRATILEARELLEQGTLVLDTETTGMDNEDVVIEIAVLDTSGGVLLDTRIHPEAPITAGALAVHSITAEMLEGAPRFTEIWPQLLALIKDRHVVCYNADFDLRLLRQTAKKVGLKRPEGWGKHVHCLMEMYAGYRGHLRSDGSYAWCSLTTACQEERIAPGHHSAAGDCRAALALLKVLAAKEVPADPSTAKETA